MTNKEILQQIKREIGYVEGNMIDAGWPLSLLKSIDYLTAIVQKQQEQIEALQIANKKIQVDNTDHIMD